MFDQSLAHPQTPHPIKANAWDTPYRRPALHTATHVGPMVALLMHPADAGEMESALAAQGYSSQRFSPGGGEVNALLALNPPLVLAEIANAGFGGFERLKSLRARGYRGRIFALIGSDDLLTSVIGLEMGADLVLKKPVDSRLLQTYVKKTLQAATVPESTDMPGMMRLGELVVNVGLRNACLNDRELQLSPVEFDLLALLCRRHGRVVSREEIGESMGLGPNQDTRVIDSRICRLRKRLAQQGMAAVTSVRGRGYIFSLRVGQAA